MTTRATTRVTGTVYGDIALVAESFLSAETLLGLLDERRAPVPAFEIDDVYYWAVPPIDDWFPWSAAHS
ncbi:MAG: hypothetical protein ACRDV3_13875 [Acidothermaceae bacterium]